MVSQMKQLHGPCPWKYTAVPMNEPKKKLNHQFKNVLIYYEKMLFIIHYY